ncbi:BES1/BZR1-like protein 4, partial [Mucuna pruriens]
MASGARQPTLKERENNIRRERRRRAIAANIFSGLRMHGNYQLPRNCENNEVLKALCNEAGWTVEPDGTTYRKGCKPVEHMDVVGGSATISPCSTYHPSPCASYNPSPSSSSFPSPGSSSYAATSNDDGNSLIPWLKNPSSRSSPTPSSNLPQLCIQTSSTSALINPPLNSPSTQIKAKWEEQCAHPGSGGPQYSFIPSSITPSPDNQINNPDCFSNIGIPQGAPTSPTFNQVSYNPFGFKEDVMVGSSSHMWKIGQSGTSSPTIVVGSDHTACIPMDEENSDKFSFRNNATGLVKPWNGERAYDDFEVDVELTLGSSKTR